MGGWFDGIGHAVKAMVELEIAKMLKLYTPGDEPTPWVKDLQETGNVVRFTVEVDKLQALQWLRRNGRVCDDMLREV